MSLGKGGGGGGGNVPGLHCTAAVPVCPGHSRPDTQWCSDTRQANISSTDLHNDQ